MKAIVTDASGNLAWSEVPTPQPGTGEVRIQVTATAVNRADLLQRQGRYPPPPGTSDILGLECAGVIDAIGPGVTQWSAGQRVCALLAGGGYAEMVVVPEGQVMPIPAGLTDVQAAALPEAYATAFLNLYGEGALKADGRALIHAGGSGVGTAAVQLCRAMGNACWVTAGSLDKLARCMELGADGGTNRHTGSFVADVRAWTHGQGVETILCPVGASYLADNQRILATDGRLVLIGLLGGRLAELDLGRMLVKRQRVIGSTLRSRPVEAKAALCRSLQQAVWPLFEAGELKPIIDRVLRIDEAEVGHAALQSNATMGKVVLTITLPARP